MVRFLLSGIALGVLASTPVHAQGAQIMTPGGILPAGSAPLDPADTLAQNLRVLALSPNDVTALTQAGISALSVGDPNAALGFLARAEGLSPRSGMIKAALGSTLVLLERPTEALGLFREAQNLGFAEERFAKDRGLAHDLLGETRLAQRDYGIALRAGSDDEVIRRYALSLGISGQREQALKLLEPLLKSQDQAAWRARAFVLAMSGDLRGADSIINQVMPISMTGTMSGFLRRLPSLNASQMAHAVNFGTMPAAGTQVAVVDAATEFRRIGGSAAQALTPAEPEPAPVLAVPVSSRKEKPSKAPRRRPGKDDGRVAVALADAQPTHTTAPAATSAKPAPGFTTEPKKPVEVAVLDARVGRRIGPVDQTRIAPEFRAIAYPEQGKPEPAPKLVRQTGMTALPAPTVADRIAAANVSPPKPPTAAVPVVSTPAAEMVTRVPLPSEAPAAPLFEIPDAKPTAVVAAPVTAQVVTAPATQATVVPVAAVPVVASPAPTPAAVVKVATLPPSSAPASAPPVATAPVAQPPRPIQVAVVSTAPAPVVTSPSPSTALIPAAAGPFVPEPAAKTPISAPSPLIGPPASTAIVEPLVSAPPPAPASAVIAPVPAPAPIAPAPEARGLAGLLDGLTTEAETAPAAVLSDAEFRKARLAAKKREEAQSVAATEAKKKEDAAKAEAEEKKRIAAQHPARYWVQVATGANRAGLSGTVSKIRTQAKDVLKGAGAATVAFKATNRILMGPYKSEAEARATVNKLAKQGVTATTYATAAGQEVTKLSSK